VTGSKADQLNYALGNIGRLFPSNVDELTYVAVYDADSRPDPTTFLYVGVNARDIFEKKGVMPPAYQQVALYVRNFSKLPQNLRGMMLKLEALYQCRWSIGYELPNYISQNKMAPTSGTSTLRQLAAHRLSYLIGHGCFLRADVLRLVGGFPTYSMTEDLSLGNILSFLQTEIVPVPFLDYCEMPDTLGRLIKQSSLWFASSTSVFATLEYLEKSGVPYHKARALYLVCQRTVMHVAWSVGGLLLMFGLAASLLLFHSPTNLPLLFFGLTSCLSYATLGIAQTLLALRSVRALASRYWPMIFGTMDLRQYAGLIALSPIKAIMNCVGPVMFMALSITGKKHNVAHFKTERT
jgi:cellulose synthase/poly-beta-1,6-N-acetylglucosamine synthase-like glycosyltransferase